MIDQEVPKHTRNGEGVPAVTPSYRVFLLEDDVDLQHALEEYLKLEGYEVTACSEGHSAVDRLRSEGPFDLALLDVMVPGRSGFEILRDLRAASMSVPVIMLTAKGEHADILRGFDLGADDYVPKPFSAELLQARLRAILSRTKSPAEKPMDVHSFGEMVVNFSSNEVRRNGQPVPFTSLEFSLLRFLITNRRRLVTRKQLLREVWNLPPEIDTRTVDRHIASLRRKIEPRTDNPVHIVTVYGRGYRFEP